MYNHNVKAVVIQFLIICLFPMTSTALSSVPNYGGGILVQSPDARGRSLGDGGGVFSEGACSPYYNPANLVSVEGNSVEFAYIKPDRNYSFVNLYAARNFGKWGYWGIGYNDLKAKHEVYSEDNYNRTKKYTDVDRVVSLNFAFRINRTYCIGASLKYLYGTHHTSWYDDESTGTGRSIAMDFGFGIRNIFPALTILKTNTSSDKEYDGSNHLGISLGVSVSNLGPGYEYFDDGYEHSLPGRIRLAAGYQIISTKYFSIRAMTDLTNFLIDVDNFINYRYDKTTLHYGFESSILRVLKINTGWNTYNYNGTSSICIGIGFEGNGLSIVYSEGDDMRNALSMTYNFHL